MLDLSISNRCNIVGSATVIIMGIGKTKLPTYVKAPCIRIVFKSSQNLATSTAHSSVPPPPTGLANIGKGGESDL